MIQSVKLENFCQHEKLAIDFDAKVIAITGSNGCGKSNLFNALQYAITGDGTVIDGSASNRIGSNQVGSVSVNLCPDGETTYEIFRSLPASKGMKKLSESRYLKYDKDKLTEELLIDEEVEKWFGIPLASLGDFVFVRQGELTRILNSTPANRMKMLSSLAGLDKAELVWDVLGGFASNIKLIDNSKVIAATNARIADVESKLTAAKSKLANLAVVTEEEYKEANSLVSGDWELAQKQEAYEQAQATLLANEAILKINEAELKDKKSALEKLEFMSMDIEQNQYIIDDWNNYEEDKKIGEALKVLKEEERVSTANAPHVIDKPDSAKLDELKAKADSISKLSKLRQDEACPYCAGHGPELNEKIKAAKHDKEELTRLQKEFDIANKLYEDSKSAFSKWWHDISVLRFRISSTRFKELRKPTVEREWAQHNLDEFVSLGGNKKITELRNVVNKLERTNLQLLMDLARDKEIVKQYKKIERIDNKTIDAAKKIVAAYSSYINSKNKLDAEIGIFEKNLKSELSLLESLTREQSKNDNKTKFTDRCIRIRSALHRSAAPAKAALDYLLTTEAPTNVWLEIMKADFRITINDSCQFIAKVNKHEIPIARLSGGQQAILAWAWICAVQDINSEKLWLLCLDEPTYGLDEVRMKALTDAINGWRDATTDRQLIIVTHDKELADSCDKIINLG